MAQCVTCFLKIISSPKLLHKFNVFGIFIMTNNERNILKYVVMLVKFLISV